VIGRENPISQQRLRWSGGLPIPTKGEVPYAKCRPELKDLSEAQIVRLVIESQPWQELMAPKLDAIDELRARPTKEKPVYSAHLLESLIVYQQICGLSSYAKTRDRLASDKGVEARELLGLNQARRYRSNPGKRVVRLTAGIPAESTMSRHRKRFDDAERAEVLEQCFRAVVAQHLEDEDFRREARTVNMDGTTILTHYTCPKYEKKTGRIVNEERVTCQDGGYVPADAGPDKSGHGWNLISVTTTTALPLVYSLPALNESEKERGRDLLDDWERDVLPHLGAPEERELVVLTADGGFNAPRLRARARGLGILENIHTASHADKPESRANATAKNNKRIPFNDPNYKHWFANGHREVFCEHGTRAKKRIRLNAQGEVISRVEGRCDQGCGSITVTSGDWRRTQNPDRFSRCLPNETDAKRDWLLGNPLTFNSLEGDEYGRRRRGHNEGFHGSLERRFRLNHGKRWFRRRDQARAATAVTFLTMHVVAMEQRKRARASQTQARSQAPPPLQLAA
jgi:hypothetical protein